MGNRIYVGNLSYDTTSETLRDAFGEHGEVSDVYIATDRETGRPRGFAFVTMGTDAEASSAIASLNNAVVDGRPLRVNEAQERTRPSDNRNSRGGHRGW